VVDEKKEKHEMYAAQEKECQHFQVFTSVTVIRGRTHFNPQAHNGAGGEEITCNLAG